LYAPTTEITVATEVLFLGGLCVLGG